MVNVCWETMILWRSICISSVKMQLKENFRFRSTDSTKIKKNKDEHFVENIDSIGRLQNINRLKNLKDEKSNDSKMFSFLIDNERFHDEMCKAFWFHEKLVELQRPIEKRGAFSSMQHVDSFLDRWPPKWRRKLHNQWENLNFNWWMLNRKFFASKFKPSGSLSWEFLLDVELPAAEDDEDPLDDEHDVDSEWNEWTIDCCFAFTVPLVIIKKIFNWKSNVDQRVQRNKLSTIR